MTSPGPRVSAADAKLNVSSIRAAMTRLKGTEGRRQGASLQAGHAAFGGPVGSCGGRRFRSGGRGGSAAGRARCARTGGRRGRLAVQVFDLGGRTQTGQLSFRGFLV